jgi:hypothetical protein
MPQSRSLLADVPIVDGHCHAPLRPPHPAGPDDLLRLLTESRDPRQIANHVPHSLYAQRALRDLAAFHGCAARLEDLLAARRTLAPAELLRRCVERGGVSSLVVDGGYRAADSYSVDEVNALLPAGCRAWPLLRLEPLLEDLLARTTNFAALEEDFALALADLRGAGYVGLKTIVAYRTGLALERPDRQMAAAAYPRVRAEAQRGPLRLASKPLLDYFLGLAFMAAGRQGLPVQVHTGFGDADLDLLQANPLLLRPALEAGAFAGAPVVLLHCYPYLREASYLASLHPDVYVDLSLSVPLLGPGCQRAVEEALELAPTTKVLYGSDAAGLAESVWLGTVAMRLALDGALGGWLRSGALTASQAERLAARVLHANAQQLYRP